MTIENKEANRCKLMTKKIKPKIILISGKKQSGKNLTASLIEELSENPNNIEVFAFADTLKNMASNFFYDVLLNDTYVDQHSYEKDSFKNKVIPFKFNEKKCTYRKFLQYFGTDFMRELFSDNLWVDNVIDFIKGNLLHTADNMFIITDARFPNEIERVQEKLGKKCDIISLRVERPSLPVNPSSHISETALDDYFFDYTIINDGTKKELKEKVKKFLEGLK
jgi:hypothetical protein